MKYVLTLLIVAACGGGSPADQIDATPGSADAGADAAVCIAPRVAIDSVLAHNTSASATYDQAHFPDNFGTTTWVAQSGETLAIDPATMDRSLNPVTPAHVSAVDVHTLVPSRPDLRWFAHLTPWFRAGGGNHIDIGLDNSSDAYAAAMLEDVARRGFDGVVVNWYGSGSYTDQATLAIQAYLRAHPELHLTIILMLDKGIAGLSEAVLEQQLGYIADHYLADPTYERDELAGGKPIVMFFGVTAVIGATGMATAKAAAGADQIWVTEGASSLAQSFTDQAFDWAHVYTDGMHPDDPYNLAAYTAFYTAVTGSAKHAFGSLMPGFNGTLTDSVGWSMGKYIPRDHGACLIQRAAALDAVIPASVTRMQMVTWSDWEEGTQVETGVENDAQVDAAIDAAAATLTWTTTTGTGDESTIDHYEIYASTDAQTAALIARVEPGGGGGSYPLTTACTAAPARLQVVAVGKPMIRDHASAWVDWPTD